MREAAAALRLTAQDLLKLGVIDRVVPEPLGGAQRAPLEAIAETGRAIAAMLSQLDGKTAEQLRADRRAKFLQIGRALPA